VTIPSAELSRIPELSALKVPRLGFVGVGWIGRHRMEAVAAAEAGTIAAVCDSSDEAVAAALQGAASGCRRVSSMEELLDLELDGVVIATPSALHADQAVTALERGTAVFCQKPLGQDAAETARVVSAARDADRLLGVDLSYRHTAAMRAIREVIDSGGVGDIFAIDLTFHNAYGPGKEWFHDRSLSGGGCVIDLGIHLVDLALWTLGFPPRVFTSSALYSRGRRLHPASDEVEDYACAVIDLASGVRVSLACSWNLSAGRDAVIEASFHGTRGGVAMRNLGGSFYDFAAERYHGTSLQTLVTPPDEWGGRAIVAWTRRLGADGRFDPEAERYVEVAAVLDSIYGH
jgi:predicted dehydrogenase